MDTETREINRDWGSLPKPVIGAEVARLVREYGWSAGRALRVATEMSRRWGQTHGFVA